METQHTCPASVSLHPPDGVPFHSFQNPNETVMAGQLVPPSRSVSSATPEPSTPYPTHPSPVSANWSGENGQFDYGMSDYPSARLHSSFHFWGNSQITQHVPQTPSVSYAPPSPKPPTPDQKYLERRKKNNEASRISRKRRKQKVEELEDRAKELLLENEDLKQKIPQLESEIRCVREQLLQFLSNRGRFAADPGIRLSELFSTFTIT